MQAFIPVCSMAVIAPTADLAAWQNRRNSAMLSVLLVFAQTRLCSLALTLANLDCL